MDVTPHSVPRLAPGMRLRHDQVRGGWVVLGPERLFMLDEHGAAVMQLVDGTRSVSAIVADLAARYNAPAAAIEVDVGGMLADLAGRGAIQL